QVGYLDGHLPGIRRGWVGIDAGQVLAGRIEIAAARRRARIRCIQPVETWPCKHLDPAAGLEIALGRMEDLQLVALSVPGDGQALSLSRRRAVLPDFETRALDSLHSLRQEPCDCDRSVAVGDRVAAR